MQSPGPNDIIVGTSIGTLGPRGSNASKNISK